MGAPESGMTAAEQPAADALLTAFRTIKDDERARHVAVLDYWLSIRGDKEFPPLHDLDPLEMSDAASCSILLELIGGGQDAEIRHLGEALTADIAVQRVIDAPSPSLLSSIARKLPIVAISRDFLAYEDNFTNADGLTRCWVTLLPLSSCGSWVDYVYAFVSVDKASGGASKPVPDEIPPEPIAEAADPPAEAPAAEEVEAVVKAPAGEPDPVIEEVAAETDQPSVAQPVEPETVEEAPVEALAEPQPEPEAELEPEPEPQPEAELAPEPDPETPTELAEDARVAKSGPGFSKILEGLSQLTGFYGQGVKLDDPVVQYEPLPAESPAPEPEVAEPEVAEPAEPEAAEEPLELEQPLPEPAPAEPAVEEPPLELMSPAPIMEGSLQNKLDQVRARADEARQAALRATAALHEGLSAAYDFALDAETSPEEYLRLVEAQGLKIQLRAPMAPVARLAFDGLVDPATLGQCEKILAWALKEEMERGALLGRIDQAGGISELAGEVAKAA